MGRIYLRHPDIEGGALVSDEPGVLEHYQARGWEVWTAPIDLDPDAPNLDEVREAEEVYEGERILSEDEVTALKGQALDRALEDAGLSKSGSADEKRARLADYQAGLADTNKESE